MELIEQTDERETKVWARQQSSHLLYPMAFKAQVQGSMVLPHSLAPMQLIMIDYNYSL